MYKPELLCPAGDRRALEAAVDAGADAVYLGSVGFNARRGAHNFDAEDMRESIALAHAYGVKVYVAQNTLILDRERNDYLSAAESALAAGADALIVADLGGASLIRRRFPEAVLHASTQMSGHNTEAARQLHARGFSRMVCAREMSFENIRSFCQNSPLEAEVFVHGALCVCHSGQCLFSSVVGGRSGNRGECAQPCRLPYTVAGREAYPLSLRDLSLAPHLPALAEAGVASLKLEGRMRSAEYVWAVTRIYRRLLDEGRGATAEEMRELAAVFSRGGFTDGYFRRSLDRTMLGVRSERDKSQSRAQTPFPGLSRRVALDIHAEVRADRPIRLCLCAKDACVQVEGPVPQPARTAPMDKAMVTKNLVKLGGTVYAPQSVTVALDEGLMLPVSALNALRREAVTALDAKRLRAPAVVRREAPDPRPEGRSASRLTARFYDPARIPREARALFDIIYQPLERFDGSTSGVLLPPVIFDSQREAVADMLAEAAKRGARHALVGNLGHLSLATEAGLIPHGDLRLNATNTASMAALETLGLADVILSPELTLPQARDVEGNRQVVVYGRLPLMLLEKCVAREVGDCLACEQGTATLCDRRGAKFPVFRAWPHRSEVYNSVVTSMSDKQDELARAGLVGRHFIFTTETKAQCAEVLAAFASGSPLRVPVRRMGNAT